MIGPQSRELPEDDRRRHNEFQKDDGCEIHGSVESPMVVCEKRHDAGQYIRWEYEEIKRTLGEYKRVFQSLLMRQERSIDRVMVEAASRKHVFYFDVTEQLNCATALLTSDKHTCPHAPAPSADGETFSRRAVIWNPEYETGMSRNQTIESMKIAWMAKSPQLVARRRIVLRDTSDPEILKRCSEWLESTWGKTLRHKRLSVIVITDPIYEQEPEYFAKSIEAFRGGFSYGTKKPQYIIMDIVGAVDL